MSILKDGYKWFVFEVVDIDTETKTHDAIQYQFKSSKQFYPMPISRAQEGRTHVNLIILTQELLTKCHGLPREEIRVSDTILRLSSRDLKKIDKNIGEFFNNKEGIKLRIWEIFGALSDFSKDIIVD